MELLRIIYQRFSNVTIDKSENIEMFISKNRIIGSTWHPERKKDLYYLFKLIEYLKTK